MALCGAHQCNHCVWIEQRNFVNGAVHDDISTGHRYRDQLIIFTVSYLLFALQFGWFTNIKPLAQLRVEVPFCKKWLQYVLLRKYKYMCINLWHWSNFCCIISIKLRLVCAFAPMRGCHDKYRDDCPQLHLPPIGAGWHYTQTPCCLPAVTTVKMFTIKLQL